MRNVSHKFDFCVVGGGMAGLCAAMASDRKGNPVAFVQDRPVFGGNAPREILMHVCGADRSNQIPNMRETGISQEVPSSGNWTRTIR